MTRFETTAAVAVLAAVALVHGPAFGQYIVIDGGTKQVPADVKGGKGPRAARSNHPAEPPKPPEPNVTAQGGFEKTKELARESAIRAAVDKVHDYLNEQDPPVIHRPTTKFVRKVMIEQLEKTDEENVLSSDGKSEKMYRVTIALKVDAENVRELRSQERSSEALWVLAGLGGLAAVVAGFFRVDAWTKGYLTSWLALGTVGAASLLAGLWWWAK